MLRWTVHAQRNELEAQLGRLIQERATQAQRQGLKELKASHSGVVRDVSVHTLGTVVQPGTAPLTLWPD